MSMTAASYLPRNHQLIVTDDDISGTFTFLRAMPDYGNSMATYSHSNRSDLVELHHRKPDYIMVGRARKFN